MVLTPRIIFHCGRGAEPWGPPSLNTTGIGGSETAVVEIARRFADDGWRVDVYGSPGQYEGEHDGVGYWEQQRLAAGTSCEVLVSWRQPQLALPVDAVARILWLHDHAYGPDAGPAIRRWDLAAGVSGYHRDWLRDAYDLPVDRVDYVPNGVDLARFAEPIKKVPFRCVYASSPDRGLMMLLNLWPRIKGDEKSAELHVAYGFQNFPENRPDLMAFKADCLATMDRTPGVVYRGRLPQDELAKLYGESVALLYPTDFLETSCIGAMEAMAGGCVPVVSSAGALKETVGDGGLIVWGPGGTRSNPHSSAWREFYVRTAQAVLFERNMRIIAEAKARERAKALTWDLAYSEHWKPIVARLLAGKASEEQVAA